MKEYDYNRMISLFAHYGYDNQVLQLAQECGELISALNRYRQLPKDAMADEHFEAIDKIKDEIVDLSVVLSGISNYFCLFTPELEGRMTEEVNKQWAKIDKEGLK